MVDAKRIDAHPKQKKRREEEWMIEMRWNDLKSKRWVRL